MSQIMCIIMIFSLIILSFHVFVYPSFFSSHAEEITPSIEILNVQSYPKIGGYWTVTFLVKGTADLCIEAFDGTTWSQQTCSGCDLLFTSIKNETKNFNTVWKNECVIIKNFSSSTIVYETSKVFTLGKHVLKFSFGNHTVYAYNDASNWWNNEWGYRKKITINHSHVSGTLSNFPVLINISDNDLQNKAELNGDDIAFVSFEDNTTQYAHEIEAYEKGNLTAWVNIPHLNSIENVSFWMYYDNDACANQENPKGVWDAHYVAVWHFLETNDSDGAKRNDSTSYGNNATTYSYDENESVNGLIGNADFFDGSDYLQINYDESLKMNGSNYTISVWMKSLDNWNTERILVEYGVWEQGTYQLTSLNDSNFKTNFNGGSSSDGSHTNQVLNDNVWHLVVGTFNDQQKYLSTFFDGTLINQTVELNSPGDANLSLYIGSRGGAANNFTGVLDEIRISDSSRNVSWIKTTYNSIINQSRFITVGLEESAAPVASDPLPSNGDYFVPSIPSYFEITVFDPNPELINITWRTNQSGVWKTFNVTNGTGLGVSDGTYQATNISWVTTFDQLYWWSVNVTDGTHWTNYTYSFTIHQFKPVVNSLDLRNNSGSKLNNQTGSLVVGTAYIFSINITDKNGWADLDYVNITSWYDDGDDTSTYNQTSGGNYNMFLQYENTSGTAQFQMIWPDDESSLQLLDCSEKIINGTTRIINISFMPGNQTRCATSNESWTITENAYDDTYSWNLNCSVADSFSNKNYYNDEYGVDYYSALRAPDLVEITGAPGMVVQSSVFSIEFISNADYTLKIYFDGNLTQVDGPDVIGINGNLSLLKSADTDDDILVNTTFNGIGEQHAITILNARSAPGDGTNSSVNVQFELSIPFGTWGTYSSSIIKKIERV
jgi:hypothetical protein